MRRLSLLLLTTACGDPSALESSASASLTPERVHLIEDHADHAIDRVFVRGEDGVYREDATLHAEPALIPPPAAMERLLAIRVAWENDVSSCSVEQLQQSFFGAQDGSLASFFGRASFEKLQLSGDAVGTIEIARTNDCDAYAWANAADEELVKRGVDLGAYTKRMYMMPSVACGWGGLGELGGVRSWINGGSCHSLPLVAHELGHTLGMHHSSTPTAEYGDLSDVMGVPSGVLRGFNAPHAAQMGWVDAPIPLESSYDAELIALSEHGGGSKIVSSALEGSAAIFISFRNAANHDAGLQDFYRDRVFVHRAYPAAMAQSVLLAHLGAGESWGDGLTQLEVASIKGGEARVSIRRMCRESPPTIRLGRVDVMAGGGQLATLSLTNNDFGACEPTGFALIPRAGSDVSVEISVPEVLIAPGATIQARVAVRAEASAILGWRSVPIDAARGIGRPQPIGTLELYVDGTAPDAPAFLTAALIPGKRGEVELETWLYLDDSSVQGVELERNGQIIATTPASEAFGLVKLGDKLTRQGVYTYRTRAYDSVGHRSEWSEPAVVVMRGRGL